MGSRIKFVNSFLASAIVAVVFITAVTIAGELYKPLKDWLKDIFTHHWIGKGVLSFVGFYLIGFLLGFVISGKRELTIALLYMLIWITTIGALAIVGFYLYETFIVVH